MGKKDEEQKVCVDAYQKQNLGDWIELEGAGECWKSETKVPIDISENDPFRNLERNTAVLSPTFHIPCVV